jgi:hypothetical protein
VRLPLVAPLPSARRLAEARGGLLPLASLRLGAEGAEEAKGKVKSKGKPKAKERGLSDDFYIYININSG